MQRESSDPAKLISAIVILFPGRNRLQGEHFAPRVRSHGYPVRDRVAEVAVASYCPLHQHVLTSEDKMRKAQITSEQRAELKALLKDSKLVKKVWIAEKLTPDGVPSSIVLAVTSRKSMILSEEIFLAKVNAYLPGFDGWVFLKNGENKAHAKKVCKVKDRLL